VGEQVRRGMALIGWGLFKKVIIADNMARIVNPIFSQSAPLNGVSALIAIYAFAFQIYGDFSGYSDIARGLGKMMGFDIMVNFNLPYFSKNPQDFWRRWHISLSTWLRDYLYIPLGGNRKGAARTSMNLFTTMLLGGLWHGAAWTYVVWGAYHGALLFLHRLFSPFFEMVKNGVPTCASKLWSFTRIFITFHLVCFGWLIFRARSMGQVGDFLRAITSNWSWGWEQNVDLRIFCFYALGLGVIQLIQYHTKNLDYVYRGPVLLRAVVAAFIGCIVVISVCNGLPGSKEFIYFQF